MNFRLPKFFLLALLDIVLLGIVAHTYIKVFFIDDFTYVQGIALSFLVRALGIKVGYYVQTDNVNGLAGLLFEQMTKRALLFILPVVVLYILRG